jgi:hypothetical protein
VAAHVGTFIGWLVYYVRTSTSSFGTATLLLLLLMVSLTACSPACMACCRCCALRESHLGLGAGAALVCQDAQRNAMPSAIDTDSKSVLLCESEACPGCPGYILLGVAPAQSFMQPAGRQEALKPQYSTKQLFAVLANWTQPMLS